MSSAILYVAIVAIWAVVLVPRWLRLRTLPPSQAVPDEELTAADGEMPEADGDLTAAGEWQAAADETLATPGEAACPPEAVAPPRPAVTEAASTAASPGPARERPAAQAARGRPARRRPAPVTAAEVRAERRARILRLRRRMLAMLTLLTAVAVAVTLLHAGPRWVAAPPAFMLAGLLVLLREAAHSDAERARRRSPVRAHPPAVAERQQDSRRQAGPAPAPAAASAAAGAAATAAALGGAAAVAVAGGEGPVTGEVAAVSAQVIDLSARMQDQLYDQYTDAAERAVGD